MIPLTFNVNERPRPKGSLDARSERGTTHVQLRESVDPEGVFRTAVARAAWSAATGLIPSGARKYTDLRTPAFRGKLKAYSGPVETSMAFRFDRKAGHGALWAPGHPLTAKNLALGVGDIEKLVRNVHDALVDAGVLADDHQVVTLGRCTKRWTDEDLYEVPGVFVSVIAAEGDRA